MDDLVNDSADDLVGELIGRMDREIAKSKSLKDLAKNMVSSTIKHYTKNMSLTDRMAVEFLGWFVERKVLPMSWDYAVDRALQYLNDNRDYIKKLGFDGGGNYKTVSGVVSALFARLADGSHFPPLGGRDEIESKVLEKALEKYR
jgi:hypothetical protein